MYREKAKTESNFKSQVKTTSNKTYTKILHKYNVQFCMQCTITNYTFLSLLTLLCLVHYMYELKFKALLVLPEVGFDFCYQNHCTHTGLVVSKKMQ